MKKKNFYFNLTTKFVFILLILSDQISLNLKLSLTKLYDMQHLQNFNNQFTLNFYVIFKMQKAQIINMG